MVRGQFVQHVEAESVRADPSAVMAGLGFGSGTA
jgi:hypothetical protein